MLLGIRRSQRLPSKKRFGHEEVLHHRWRHRRSRRPVRRVGGCHQQQVHQRRAGLVRRQPHAERLQRRPQRHRLVRSEQAGKAISSSAGNRVPAEVCVTGTTGTDRSTTSNTPQRRIQGRSASGTGRPFSPVEHHLDTHLQRHVEPVRRLVHRRRLGHRHGSTAS